MQRKNLQEGFTVVDLVVALALFGVVATTSYDALSRAIPRWRVGRGANDIAAAIRAARTKAIFNGTEAVMPVDVDGGRYAVFTRWSIRDEKTPPAKEPFRIARLPDGVSFVNPRKVTPVTTVPPGLDDPAVKFDPRGRLMSTSIPGFVYVGNPARAAYARVGVDFAGNVRVQRWNGASWR